MNNREEFLKKIIETFRAEAKEGIQKITSNVLELEKVSSVEREMVILEAAFREAHSLKGAARAVNNNAIESICQGLEGVFSVLKRKQIDVSAGLISVLLIAVSLMDEVLESPELLNRDLETRKSELLELLLKAEKGILISSDNSFSTNTSVSEKQPEDFLAKLSENMPSVSPEKEIISKLNPEKQNTQQQTIRVSTEQLDEFLVVTEEMLSVKLSSNQITKELSSIISKLTNLTKSFDNSKSGESIKNPLSDLKSINDDLKELRKFSVTEGYETSQRVDTLLDEVKKVLAVPFTTLIDEFPNSVRRLSQELGKHVDFQVSGENTVIDRRILQGIRIPILHLLRNCIDHGIENHEERLASGKQDKAAIRIDIAQLDDNKVEIIISDNGRGINFDRLKSKYNKFTGNNETIEVEDSILLDFMFSSGVSTSEIITELSGRGLGLAIVKEKIEQLGGIIRVYSVRNEGTAFRINLPLSIETFRCVRLRVADQEFVIPTIKIELVTRVPVSDVKTVENRAVFTLDNKLIPLVYLGAVLDIPRPVASLLHYQLIVLGKNGSRTGFIVDEILDEDEMLLKRFNKHLLRVRNISGATVSGSGKVIPMLNVTDLLKSATNVYPNSVREIVRTDRIKSLLIVEDSITSRTLLKNILEHEGYNVTTAYDGVDGLVKLKAGQFDLVISDIDMPRMSGFDFVSALRTAENTRDIPVVLVTSLSKQEDQQRGMEVGANAYIIKSNFDQNTLLDVIERLL